MTTVPPTKKLQILAIHGYRQSEKAFRTKLGSVKKLFKRQIEFTFLNAPHSVPPLPSEEKSLEDEDGEQGPKEEGFGWWFNNENKEFHALVPSDSAVGFQESLELVEKTFRESGPFDGLLGFSQGASFVSILCSMQQKKLSPIKFDFAILISGFQSLCAPHSEFYSSEKIDLPTLHIYGENDRIIPQKDAIHLTTFFQQPRIVTHEGGHFVPGKRHFYDDFVREMLSVK